MVKESYELGFQEALEKLGFTSANPKMQALAAGAQKTFGGGQAVDIGGAAKSAWGKISGAFGGGDSLGTTINNNISKVRGTSVGGGNVGGTIGTAPAPGR